MATLLAASITGTIAFVVVFVTYILTRRQEVYKVQYANLYERRAKIVAGLFRLLKELEAELRDWIALHENYLIEDQEKRTSKRDAISEKLQQLKKQSQQQSIWLDEASLKTLRSTSNEISNNWRRVRTALARSARRRDFNPAESAELNTAKRWLSKELREALDLHIYSEFREMLGMDELQISSDDNNQSGTVGGRVSKNRLTLRVVSACICIGLGLGIILWELGLLSLLGIFAVTLVGIGAGLLLDYFRNMRMLRRKR